ncbi:glycerol-3-phosphate dehydrogenase/oxidase [Archaeoglobus veneficus]|uniref:Glycerol-3-phosphate dehydrogenase n=1 Tax=Archaeoglobus veneficus (strain DSM 11195 / SNP6) TaxID=693661 RepID=F2KR17_ARCVS|nr:glycerol-3-phosphate dehydrogenase/oxidase [Archaeoglobus veneficus]AEA47823.1 Glycerol-3-phosphate dehydrogenase [Archaeoglobus veneficus SNP6]
MAEVSKRLNNVAGKVDLLVVGGGITGAGIALDAASRGLKVVLVEKGDFASGTSSASSKLIHGGFRYLKSRDFRLVFEALHERGLLLKLAPGLVKPLPFLIPVYGGGFKHIKKLIQWVFAPEKITMMELVKAPLALRAAVFLYDLLAGREKIKKHRILSKEDVLRVEPELNPRGLKSGAIYWDAFGLDFRLTLSIVKKARDYGAICVNYAKVVEFLRENCTVVGARVRDRLSGEEFDLFARKVVVAAGPWADIVRTKAGIERRVLRPTKGSHIVVSRDRLSIRNAVVMEAIDGRLTFAIPWDDTVIIGTTEIEFYESPDEARITKEEVDYLLEVANRYFPSANLGYDDILSTYSGVRPLIDVRGLSATDVSREHRIVEENGMITIAGGKLTTYRVMAKDVVDRVVKDLGVEKECTTHSIRLKEPCREEDIDIDDIDVRKHLSEIYSREEVERIVQMVKENPSLGERILPEYPHIWAEVTFAVTQEFAVRLSDVIIRRLGLYFKSPDGELARRIAEHMGEILGWDAQRIEKEVREYLKEVKKNMEWRE